MIDAKKLQGLSLEVASKFGMPDIGVSRKGSSYHLKENAKCICCKRPATNCHHVVPLGKKRSFKVGRWTLASPLFALCGSGTTGCHNNFHGGARFKATWHWNLDTYENMWFSGELLDIGVKPHSNELYMLGYWVIEDKKTGEKLIIDHG